MNTRITELDAARKRAMLAELLLAKHRGFFDTLADKAYFNYGAMGIVPLQARKAVLHFFDRYHHHGPFSLDGQLVAGEVMESARSALALELGASAENLALTGNTSMGCNTVLWGTDWKQGDRLLMTDCEYPGIVAAVAQLSKRFGIQVDTLPVEGDDQRILEHLETALTARTRLVVLSHITWNTGRILPLAEMLSLCRTRSGERTRILVDGAQSVGVLPLDLTKTGADFYAFPGQKWLCGPEGTGALYLGPGALDELQSTFIGGRALAYQPDRGFLGLAPGRSRFEISSQPTALYAGLHAALVLHNQWGDAHKRYKRIGELSGILRQRLRSSLEKGCRLTLSDEGGGTGFVFIKVTDNQRLVSRLEARGFLTRTIPEMDCIRISIHYLTTIEELDRLVENIENHTTPK